MKATSPVTHTAWQVSIAAYLASRLNDVIPAEWAEWLPALGFNNADEAILVAVVAVTAPVLSWLKGRGIRIAQTRRDGKHVWLDENETDGSHE